MRRAYRILSSLEPGQVWEVASLLLIVSLCVATCVLSRTGGRRMGPAIDLRRVTFPTVGVKVEEHGPETITIVTDDWIFSMNSVDDQGAKNLRGSLRGITAWSPDSRVDVLGSGDSPVVHRLLRGMKGPTRAVQARYVIDFGDGWAYASASARTPLEPLDLSPIDRILLASRLADEPLLEVEVPPAWLAYQRDRKGGSPIAKFALYMDPAPVLIGGNRVESGDWTPFTREEYERGGRQMGPDLFEFYTKGDATWIRLDLCLDEPPRVVPREVVFEARLRLDHPRILVRSFDRSYPAAIPTGEYDVTVTLVNRGKDEERSLTERELFDRDDLERYEVFLRPRRTMAGPVE
jgi:hypothetical protein